ncbi:MAG: type I secretion system permease/ATPase [Methyloceanibacter sp.]
MSVTANPSLPPSPSAELAAALRSCRSAFVGVGLFSFVVNILMLTGALFMLEIYDRVLPSRSLPTLIGLGILVLVLFALHGLLDLVRSRMLVRIGTSIDEQLRGRMLDTILRLPLAAGNQGNGIQPMRDLESVRSFLAGAGPVALFDLPWIPVYLAVIFAFHVALGMTALAGAVLLVGLTLLTAFLSRAPMKSSGAVALERTNFADACRRNAEVITAMGMAGRIEAKWEELSRRYMTDVKRVGDVAGGFGALSKVLRLALQSAVLAVGAFLVIEQEATAGIIIAASILAGRALAPVDLAIAQSKSLIAARQSWQRLNALLSRLPVRPAPLTLPDPKAKLTVRDLCMAAPGTRRTILQGVSFGAEAGSALAVVGPTGSGKSTLVRALVGVWQPLAGRISLDGADLDQWSNAELGRLIGYLPQDVELFSGTIAENIARFDSNAAAEDIVAAATAAGVHDFIVSLREGYNTEIGEQGESLSAGQRQRIALARALYRDPFLVVLDEPNSNLDAEGEAALTAAILGVRERGGIVVIVAHRPNALVAADLILVLNQGRSQAFGEKDAILAANFPKLQTVSADPARIPPPPQALPANQAVRTGT